MDTRVSLVPQHANYQDPRGDQLPILYRNSFPQPMPTPRTNEGIVLSSLSDDQYLDVLIPEPPDPLPSERIWPRTLGNTHQSQMAAYRQAEQFQPTEKDQRLRKVDTYV